MYQNSYFLNFKFLAKSIFRDALKKDCWEGDIGPYRGEGGKKSPFLINIKGDIQTGPKRLSNYYSWGQNFFVTCPMFIFKFMFPHKL